MFNNEIRKRRYYDDSQVIDLPCLLNYNRILSKKEFERKLPTTSYSQYYNIYLQRKSVDIFELYSNEQWFKDRYLTNQKQDIYTGNFKKIIEVKNWESSKPISDVIADLKAIVPTAKILINQNKKIDEFNRSIFIVSDDFEPESVIDNIKVSFDANIVDLSDNQIPNLNLANIDQMKILFEELLKYSKKENIDEEIIKSARSINDPNIFSDFMKKYFYFCTNCCKKFDNQFQMLISCKNHSERHFCERNYDILSFPKNINIIKNPLKAIEEYGSKTKEENLMCNTCKKVFSSSDSFISHLIRKHVDIVSEITGNSSLYITFINNIDFFAFELIFGTEDCSVPEYGKVNIHDQQVVYDLPCIFTGEF